MGIGKQIVKHRDSRLLFALLTQVMYLDGCIAFAVHSYCRKR